MTGFAKLGNLCTIAIANSSSFSTCSSHEQRLNLLSFLAIYFVVIIIVMFMTPNFLMVNKKSSKRPRRTKYLEHYYFRLFFSLPSFWFVCFICVCLLPPLLLLDHFMICLVCVCKHEITKWGMLLCHTIAIFFWVKWTPPSSSSMCWTFLCLCVCDFLIW
jgi:hypothetical protein